MESVRPWFNYWKDQASEETNKNRESLHLNGRVYGKYVTTVFLLDTSASMAGKGLEQMKTAFKDIIHEFSQHPSIAENVTVITCGRDVKVLQYYSTNYTKISECVDSVECSGRSPLGAGLVLSLSGIWSAPYCSMGSFGVRTRIVIITCGKPTAFDSENDSGIFGDTDLRIPDIENPYGLNRIKESVIKLVMSIGRYNPVFVIPVGDEPDICFLGTLIMGSHGGKIIPFHEARQFGRYALNINLASKVIERHPTEVNISKEMIKVEVFGRQNVSERDLEDVREIIEKKHAYRSSSCFEKEREEAEEGEFQEKYAYMPNVGTRVRRGPDWRWKNQDGLGAGTVTGHSERFGWVNVEWDTGLSLSYRYGSDGLITAYDIEPSDEPRILEHQAIAVGCLVRRGPDWKWDDQDGGEGNIGAVYRLKTPTEVYVRWPNGNKSNYRFGYRSYYDVEICDPFEPGIEEMLKMQMNRSQTRHTKEMNTNRANIANASWSSSSGEMTLTIIKSKQGTDVSGHGRSGGGCVFKNTSNKSIKNVWQWRSPSNTWNNFPKDANDSIVDVFTKGKGTSVVVNLQGQLCRVNLKNNSMVNTITKEAFDIRPWNENDI